MYQYKAKLIRVIDGDTIDAMIDLGFNTWVKKRIRLAEMDAYELRTRNKEEKKPFAGSPLNGTPQHHRAARVSRTRAAAQAAAAPRVSRCSSGGRRR